MDRHVTKQVAWVGHLVHLIMTFNLIYGGLDSFDIKFAKYFHII